MNQTMNKSKYSEGDRLGVWKIASVHYAGDRFGYVYDLVRFEGVRKFGCTCTEKVLVQMFGKQKSA